MTDDELRASNEFLTAELRGVREDMKKFFRGFDDYKDGQAKKTSVIVTAIVVLGVLFAIVGSLAVSNWRNSDRLERLTQVGVCPSNAFQLGSYDPTTRKPEDRDAYERSIAQLRAARVAIGCEDYELTPPRIDK